MEVSLAAGDHSCDCAEIIWQWLAQEVRDGFGYNARFVVKAPATETGWIKSGGLSGVSNHPKLCTSALHIGSPTFKIFCAD